MRRLRIAIFALIALASAAPLAHAQQNPPVRALRFGKLIDGKGKVWTDAIVLIRGDRIAEVISDASKIPAGAEIIDLRRFTAIPGLIDVHTHITYYWDQSSKVHPFDQARRTRLPAVAFSSLRKTPAAPSKPASPRSAISAPTIGTTSPCAT